MNEFQLRCLMASNIWATYQNSDKLCEISYESALCHADNIIEVAKQVEKNAAKLEFERLLSTGKLVDMLGKPCMMCGYGFYTTRCADENEDLAMHLQVLHCSNDKCYYGIERYR